MPSPKIRNIILDLGNTLVYFDYIHFYEGIAAHEKNLSAGKLKKFFTDNDFDLMIGSGKLTLKKVFSLLRKEFDLKIKYADFYNLYIDIFWENSHMKDFLENTLLDSGFRLYILSNVDATHINFINKNFPYVNNVKKRILSYKVKTIKPERKIFMELIKKFNIDPEESIFIDDLQSNVDAAKKIGFKTIRYISHKKFLKEFNLLTKTGDLSQL